MFRSRRDETRIHDRHRCCKGVHAGAALAAEIISLVQRSSIDGAGIGERSAADIDAVAAMHRVLAMPRRATGNRAAIDDRATRGQVDADAPIPVARTGGRDNGAMVGHVIARLPANDAVGAGGDRCHDAIRRHNHAGGVAIAAQDDRFGDCLGDVRLLHGHSLRAVREGRLCNSAVLGPTLKAGWRSGKKARALPWTRWGLRPQTPIRQVQECPDTGPPSDNPPHHRLRPPAG